MTPRTKLFPPGGTVPHRLPTYGARRGTTLVEILVVLVILVIGLFAIAQLFPGGFFSIGHTGNVTQAGALAQRNEDYLLNNREHIPDAIVAVNPDPTVATGLFLSEVTPDDLHAERPYRDNAINGFTGPPPADPRFSGPNQVRRVLGEHLKVPPPVTGFGPLGETVALYRCLFSPIYSAQPVIGTSLGVSASGATPLQRVICTTPPSPENIEELFQLGQFGYGVDYSTQNLYLISTDQDRLFRFDGRFRQVGGGAGQAFVDNCLFASAGPPTQRDSQGNVTTVFVATLPLMDGKTRSFSQYDAASRQVVGTSSVNPTPPPDCVWIAPTGNVDPGSDLSPRRCRMMPLVQAFSADPFEFKVYDPVLGLIGFHPAAATVPLPRQEGRGLTARLDYDVDDWFILHQDEVVPTEYADPAAMAAHRVHAIRLSTGPIKRIGEVEDTINFPATLGGAGPVDTTFEYQGLVRYYPASAQAPYRLGTPGLDVIVVDLQTGLVLDNMTLTKPAEADLLGGTNTNGEIDYERGIIHLRELVTFQTPQFVPGQVAQPVLPAVPVAGRHLRIYYRSANDFAVATFKPSASYYAQSLPARLQTREFYPGYGFGFALFNATDANKVVSVDYSWLDRNTGQLHVETGELQRIQPPQPESPFGPTPGFGGVGGVDPGARWWIRVGHADPDSSKAPADAGADPDVLPQSVQIQSIRGVSFHNRVVWREANRWKSRERATMLSREFSR